MKLRPSFSLRSFYFATWWALVCLALLNAFFATIVPGWALGLTFLFCLPSLMARMNRGDHPAIGLAVKGFLAASLLAAAVSYHFSHNIVDLLGFGLIAFLPFVLWRNRDARGNWIALLQVFLISQVSLLVGEEAVEFLLFILFALAFVFNLNSAHLYFHLGAFESRRTAIPRHYFRTFFYSTLLGMGLALGLFFLFPRSIQWVNPLAMRTKERITGYTGSISLDGSSLKESSEVVMEVESNDLRWLAGTGPNLYFRGNTVDKFDGVRWKRSHGRIYHYHNPRSIRFTRAADNKFHVLKIYREPLSGDWVFYPGLLRDVLGPQKIVSQLRYDEHGDLFRAADDSERYFYEIVMSLVKPSNERLEEIRVDWVRNTIRKSADDYGEPAELGDEPRRFLEIPPSVGEQPYFKRWIDEVGLKPKKATLVDVLQALSMEFHSRYKSTYQHDIPSVDSFKYFLSQGREGHCEYFATAAVLYLRQLGIPARVVLGYRGATFNEVSHVLEIRQSGAHAWVELFVPETGWLNYDPTPMKVQLTTPGFWEYVALYSSAAKFWFQRYVVQYNSETQSGLAKQLVALGKSRSGKSGVSWTFAKEKLLWILLVILGLGIAFLRKNRWRRTHARTHGVPDYYRKFRRQLKKKGLVQSRGETYAAFHARVKKTEIDAGWVTEIDRALEREIYAGDPCASTERQRLKRLTRRAA